MSPRHRLPRRAGMLALIALTMTLFASLPPRSAQAVLFDKPVDDNLSTFSDGIFQRTALSSAQVGPSAADSIGAIQLAPTGALKPWVPIADRLPQAVSDAGLVAIGNRLYLVGGTTNVTAVTGGSTEKVFVADVNQRTGTLVVPNGAATPWTEAAPLPAVDFTDDADQCTATAAARTRAAIAGITTGTNTGYIYVVGGSFFNGTCNGANLSGVAVNVGTVAGNGSVTWSDGPDFPTAEGATGIAPEDFGIEDASAAIVRTASNKAFLYVFGGRRIYDADGRNGGGTSIPEISREVFYAEISLSNGSLGAWKRGPDIPPPIVGAPAGYGLRATTAIPITFDVGGGGQQTRSGIILSGGHINAGANPAANEYSTAVFRADVNPETGDLTWDTTPGSGNKAVSIPAPRVDMAAVSYNSKLYMVGGAPSVSAAAVRTVPTATFGDDLNLIEVAGLVNTFFTGAEADVLPSEGRVNHMVVTVPAIQEDDTGSGVSLGGAWVFTAGGRRPDGSLTDTIFRGRIGGADEADESTVASTGWYYGAPISITIGGSEAEVLKVRWTTSIDRAASPAGDIKLEYRTSIPGSGRCDLADSFSGETWKPLQSLQATGAFSSTNGFNEFSFPTEAPRLRASCFEYRAFLNLGGTKTPALLNLNLQTRLPGSPDLRTLAVSPQIANNRIMSFEALIVNKNISAGTKFTGPTLGANYDGRGGQFFVDLCIFAPGEPVILPQLPLDPSDNIPDCRGGAAEIAKTAMGVDVELRISQWQWRKADGTPVKELKEVFEATAPTGEYRFVVIIDADNQVKEGFQGAPNDPEEINNISQQFVINVDPSQIGGNFSFLPLVRK